MMEKKDRSFRSLAVIAVLVAVVGISVAFAALSQLINIDANARIPGNPITNPRWSIILENLQPAETLGTAVVDSAAVLTNNSTTMSFAVSLKKPGDAVIYYVDVANKGEIDAKVSGVTLTGITAAQANDIIFTVTYRNGAAINVGDTLNAGVARQLVVIVEYDWNAENLPEDDVELSLGATITYVQQ